VRPSSMIKVWFAGLVFFAGVPWAVADVKLSPVFSDHMVLQREMPVPVWGTAAPGEEVTVTLGDQSKQATADAAGKWSLKLDPLKAGGPLVLKVQGKNAVELSDVLVGDVWLGSGQSNMQGAVGGYVKGDETLAKLAAASYPKLRLKKGNSTPWQESNEQNNPGMSAILFAFGVRLQQDLNVPVGIMVGAVGGTPSGYWLSESAYESDAACKEVVQKALAKYDPEQAQKNYEAAVAKWEQAVEASKAKGEAKQPGKPAPPVKPGEGRGKIGNLYEAHIRPYIPFAIRGVVWDQGESGTAIQDVDQYTLMGALIHGWRQEWGQGDFPFIYVQKPSGGGCAWDPADPVTVKAEKFAPLPGKPPAASDGLYRENHIRIMQYPHTAMAISTDLGSGIHPVNKSGYGARAARVALGMAYGRDIEYYGPLYQSHQVDDNKVRVKFTHVGKGLTPRHADKLQGFTVAGDNKVFYWAEAKIEGDTVIVSSPEVSQPVAVRYAWSNSSPWANLFNQDELPAPTFRTDSW
jgi:sialate O-acetylesterase